MAEQKGPTGPTPASSRLTGVDVTPRTPGSGNTNAARPVAADTALDAGNEADESLSEDLSVLTQSVRSSVYDYKFENGRRYHAFKEGMYFLPNDEPEQERMDIQARAMMLASGQLLHHAPIEDPQRIIDLGTGTGLVSYRRALYSFRCHGFADFS